MSNYQEPKTEDLPRLLAEAMGWAEAWCGDNIEGGSGRRPWWRKPWGSPGYPYLFACEDFKPHLSHDHAQLAVEECFKRGLDDKYITQLAELCGAWDIESDRDGDILHSILLATPEQKSRAALKTLTSNPKP